MNQEYTARSLTRRDFLRGAGLALSTLLLGACGRQERLRITATLPPPTPTLPPPTPTPAPVSTATPVPLAPVEPADLVLTRGRVMTMDPRDTIAQALAVHGDRILAVGDDDQIRAFVGPQTQVLDLGGKAVTPGLIDSHNHLSAVGLIGTAYIDINPPGVKTIADLQARIAEGVARTPPGRWVIAQGFVAFEGRQLDRHDLDPVSPDHPVMLINQGGHIGAVNSYALRMAGVTANTPNPPFGLFVRDEGGEPTGLLINHSAMDVFRRLWARDVLTREILDAATITPQVKFAAVGVTTFEDVNARGLDKVAAYFDAARRGQMSIRGYILNTIEYYQELKGRVDAIRAIQYEDEYMRFGGFKFLVDGAGAVAYTHEPHKGLAWDIATWDLEQLKEAVSTLHAAGYQCAFHVIGDAAVDMALDAIEYAMNAHPRSDPRHRLEHAALNTDAAIQRTRDLGVVVSTQPQVIRLLGDYWRDIWGEERARRIVPTRSWLDRGIPLALSSDAPTMPWYQPQITLAGALLRLTASNQVLGPDQRLTIGEAIRAHTMGGAYAAFEDGVKGSLEPGKLADLIVWTEDPYMASPQQLVKATIDLTMVGGKIVHQV